METTPNFLVERTAVHEPLDPARLVRRVQAREVAALADDRAGRAADLLGELVDLAIAVVQSPEGGVAIQAEGRQRLAFVPVGPGGHGAA